MPQMPPLSDEALKDLLSKPHWAKIATSSPKGSIRISPVAFAAQPDGSLLMNTYEDSILVRNLRRNPKCSLLIDAPEFPPHGVHYWGTATVEGPENDVSSIVKTTGRYVEKVFDPSEYAQQLIGYGKRINVRFRPERNTAWDFRQG
ncbi:MAG: pyridoxamine 5'-phosphate oxidase family protein [Dehalococcoidia bacterium]